MSLQTTSISRSSKFRLQRLCSYLRACHRNVLCARFRKMCKVVGGISSMLRFVSLAVKPTREDIAYLGETNICALLTEALTANVQAVLADKTSLVCADTTEVLLENIERCSTFCSPFTGTFTVCSWTAVPDRFVRHDCCVDAVSRREESAVREYRWLESELMVLARISHLRRICGPCTNPGSRRDNQLLDSNINTTTRLRLSLRDLHRPDLW